MAVSVEQLFYAARECALEDRAAFLDSACGADAALRERVEMLLRAELEAGSFLTGGSPAHSHDARSIDGLVRSGQTIGRYRLLEQIGEGGFGAVWMAEQHEPVVRRVALKIIKLGMDTREVIARFEAERQALALMEHPNIAKVLDAGATDTGRPYFVMELCSGESITQFCDRHRLAIRERLALMVQVCQAVQHAHQKGLIHRDIKPSNILVDSQDHYPQAKVIDFGIAKATLNRLTEKTLLTGHRQLIGSPQYMSPEQVEGDLDIDTRTDIYSLGVLLYELLSGAPPFDSTKRGSAASAELQRAILEDEPPPPSARLSQMTEALATTAARRRVEPHKLGPLIRGELDWIVMKCLEKDRRRRYETANGLAADIGRYLTGETVAAAPPSRAYRIRKFIRRYRAGVIAGSLVAISLVLGVIGTTAGLIWALNEKARADLAAQAESVAKRKAEDNATAALLAGAKAERAAYNAQMISAASAVEDQRMDGAASLLAATSPRLRGWEYAHLTSRLDRSLASPFPADWRISRFSRAETGVTAVLRTDDKASAEWVVLNSDLRTERFGLPGTGDGTLVVSPDGSRGIWTPTSTTDQQPAVLWDLATGLPVTTIQMQPGRGTYDFVVVTWAPAGDRFIISRNDEFEVFDARDGSLLHRSEADGTVRFTHDARWMLMVGPFKAATFDARAMRLVDAVTYEPRPEVFRFESPIVLYSIAFRGSRFACSFQDGSLQIVDIEDGAIRPQFSVAPGIGVITDTAWSPDGRMIAAGTTMGRVGVWEANSLALRDNFAGPQFGTASLLFLLESSDLLVCDFDGHHYVWPVTSRVSSVLADHRSFVYSTAISKDGGLLLTGGWDGLVDRGQGGGLKLWNARTGTLIADYGQPGQIFQTADLTPDGRFAVAGIRTETELGRRTEVLDLVTGNVTRVWSTPARALQPMHTLVHPDGRRVIATYHPNEAYVWDISTGEILYKTILWSGPDQDRNYATAAAVSPDGGLIAFSDQDLGIRLVNAETYADVRRWDAHSDVIWGLSFSPDGAKLLSASSDDTVGVWEAGTGALVARLAGHNADVFCVAMNPDGTRIASGGRDRYLRLWDTTHFENVVQLGGHRDYIYSISWSPDGQQLFTGSGDSTVRVWDTRTLSERIDAVRARSEAMPGIEARIVQSRAETGSLAEALERVCQDPGMTVRDRECAREAAAHFASRGTPAYYRARRASSPIVIDGQANDGAWSDAPWSPPFVDIEGDVRPKPRYETRMRMLWDDTNLYVFARLDDPHVCAILTERDSIVLRDNDFELFIDPDGDARNYYEFEFNALNAVFDLLLVRRYLDGGPAKHEWNLRGIQSAVHIEGSINDPRDVDRGWTIEMALPWDSLAEYAKCPSPPRPGDVWRVNFSRVQWQYDVVDERYVKRQDKEDNWVWSPQRVVDMHVPDRWGFVEFADSPGRAPDSASPSAIDAHQ